MIARGLGPELLTRWWSEAPAKLASLQDRKGRLAIGFDADIVVRVNLNSKRMYKPNADSDMSARPVHMLRYVTGSQR